VEKRQPGWAPQVGAHPPIVGAHPTPSSSYKLPPPASIFFTQAFQKTTQVSVSRERALVVKREESREEEKSGKEVGSF